MPATAKPKAISPKTSYRRKCSKDKQRKKIVKSRSQSIRHRRGHGEICVGMILNSKFPKQKGNRVVSVYKKQTNHNRTSPSKYNKNDVCKRVSRIVKKKKDEELFIHQKPKKVRKKMNNVKKTQLNTKNANKNLKKRKSTHFDPSSHGPPKFIQELKTLLLTTLTKSQQNIYAKNQYRNNDIDQVHLTNLMESISYPKFVYDDTLEQDSNYRYGKQDNSKKSDPFENEPDVISWWTTNKGMTSELDHSKFKTCPKTLCHNMNDLKEGRVPSSLDYSCANTSRARFCKTQSNLNAITHQNNDNCSNALSNNKLICKINIEFDRMKNDKYCDYLVANSDNVASVLKGSKDFSDPRELDIDDFADDMSIKTKIEMKNEFVKACDLVFDTFKDKVFDTVYSDYLASVRNLRRILH